MSGKVWDPQVNLNWWGFQPASFGVCVSMYCPCRGEACPFSTLDIDIGHLVTYTIPNKKWSPFQDAFSFRMNMFPTVNTTPYRFVRLIAPTLGVRIAGNYWLCIYLFIFTYRHDHASICRYVCMYSFLFSTLSTYQDLHPTRFFVLQIFLFWGISTPPRTIFCSQKRTWCVFSVGWICPGCAL